MSEPVQQGLGEPFAAHNLNPVLEGQIGGDDQAGAFIGPTNRLEEQFGSGFRERDVAQLIQDDELEAFELLVKALELT